MLGELLDLAKAGRITGLNWSVTTDQREILSGMAGVMRHDVGLSVLSAFKKAVDVASGKRMSEQK